jgi:hypothetical protein
MRKKELESLLAMRQLIAENVVTIVPPGDNEHVALDDRFQVVFDTSTNKQVSIRDTRNTLREVLRDEFGREPSKKELNRGFAKWRSYWKYNKSGKDREAIVNGQRFIFTGQSNTDTKPDSEMVKQEIIKTARGISEKCCTATKNARLREAVTGGNTGKKGKK